jgi:hypothetical protein
MCSNINPSSTDENHTVNSPNHTLAVDRYFFPDNKFLVSKSTAGRLCEVCVAENGFLVKATLRELLLGKKG